MLHIDELQQLCFVAHHIQQLGPNRIGCKRGKTLLQDAMSQQRLQYLVLHLVKQLMLTARNG
ncbi:hypothetical protein D3C81_1251630 [compost metagenome]